MPFALSRRHLAPLLLALLTTGCAHYVRSTPPPSGQPAGIQLIQALPTQLPAGGHRFPGQLFVLLPQDSAATLLMPIPFVGEAIESGIEDARARHLAAGYTALDPFKFAAAATANHPLFHGTASAKLYPYVFVNEGFDAHYRLSLVFQVEQGKWLGRYFYHLPTILPKAEVGAPDPATVTALQRDMTEGAAVLVRLIERDYHGELKPTGRVATIGSLYLVGGKIGGLVSPTALTYPGAQVLEESPAAIVLRHEGQPAAAGQAGALLFGVHHFRRDQLSVFKPQ